MIQKVLNSDLESPEFVPLETNLTQFCPKSDTPVSTWLSGNLNFRFNTDNAEPENTDSNQIGFFKDQLLSVIQTTTCL